MPPKKRNTWNEYQKNCTQGTKKATREIAKEYKDRKERCNDLLVSCHTVFTPTQAAELKVAARAAQAVRANVVELKSRMNAARASRMAP